MTPPGEAGTAAPRRLGRDPLVRTLSATEEVAALLTSRRCFTEVSDEAAQAYRDAPRGGPPDPSPPAENLVESRPLPLV